MSTYLITGTSRGIGFELVKQLLDLPSNEVSSIFAVTRSDPSDALRRLIENSDGRVVNVIMDDLTDETKVRRAIEDVDARLQGRGIDVLVNNAGTTAYSPELVELPCSQLVDVLRVNVAGVHVLTAAAMPLLQKGKEKKVINISTTLGSITWSHRFTFMPTHAYKISKAAVNMLTRQYAMEYADQDFTFLAISPGWLKSDMGTEAADLDVSVGVRSVKEWILTANKDMNGKFVNIRVPGWEDTGTVSQYDGEEIPW